MTGRIWCCCTTGSPYADSTPQTPSMTEALDAEVLFDAGEQRRILLRLLLAGNDAPVGHAPIEILPDLLVEFGLIADRLKAGGVGAQPAHDAVVCVSADAAAKRLGAERSDPMGKIAGSARPRRAGREGRSGGKRQPKSLAMAGFSDAGAAIGDLGFLHG